MASSLTGAWIRAYDVECGGVVSESSSIGWGWRHVLFYNDFASRKGDDPLYYLVDVLTPHVRKTLQFFDMSSGSEMEMKASTSKYTTHDIGWRYLDTAISGDLNGDGINEAVLLDENLQNLVSFQLLDDGAGVSVQEVWSIPLVGKLSSNIAAVSYRGKGGQHGVALAAASGSKLRVWVSKAQGSISTTVTSTSTSSSRTSAVPITTTTTSTSSSTTSAVPITTTNSPGTLSTASTASSEQQYSTSTAVPPTTPASSTATSTLPDATTTSVTTTEYLYIDDASINSNDDPSASNDELGIDFSSTAPKNCSAQSKLATGTEITFAALLTTMILAS